jgi:hypothetical protein
MLKAGNKKVLNYGPGRKSNVGRSIIRGTDQRKFYGDRRVHYYYYHHHHHHHLLITGFLSPGTSTLEPMVHPPTQNSSFYIMCDVPSTTVFLTEATEGFPGTVYRYFFSPSVTIPVAPVINQYDEAFHISHSLNFSTYIFVF